MRKVNRDTFYKDSLLLIQIKWYRSSDVRTIKYRHSGPALGPREYHTVVSLGGVFVGVTGAVVGAAVGLLAGTGGVALEAGELEARGGGRQAAPLAARAHRVRLLEAGAQPEDDAQRRRVLPVAPRVPVLGLLVEPAPFRLRTCNDQRASQ